MIAAMAAGENRAHGRDERVGVATFQSLEWAYRLVKTFGGKD